MFPSTSCSNWKLVYHLAKLPLLQLSKWRLFYFSQLFLASNLLFMLPPNHFSFKNPSSFKLLPTATTPRCHHLLIPRNSFICSWFTAFLSSTIFVTSQPLLQNVIHIFHPIPWLLSPSFSSSWSGLATVRGKPSIYITNPFSFLLQSFTPPLFLLLPHQFFLFYGVISICAQTCSDFCFN